jgi:hypothetical protein
MWGEFDEIDLSWVVLQEMDFGVFSTIRFMTENDHQETI